MEYFLLLTVSTAIIFILTLLIWQKTKNISFPVGFFFLYFWSLYGGWFITIDGTSGDSGMHYHYLLKKLFPVFLNDSYFWSLVWYSAFIIIIQLTVFVVLMDHKLREPFKKPIFISHYKVIFISLTATFLSFMIVKEQILSSISSTSSIYVLTRHTYNPLMSIHQELNRVALIPLSIGIAVFFSGNDAKYMVGERSYKTLTIYMGSILMIYGFCFMLGNKNEILFSLIAGVLFYVVNAPKPRYLFLFTFGLVGFVSLAIVDFFRGTPLLLLMEKVDVLQITTAAISLFSSNEAFSAHFSMYGVFEFDVPITYGRSIVSLIVSVVPRVLWPDRIGGAYQHYSESVGAISGQGYTIHHATAWYLNFGFAGIVIGAVIFGLLWSKLYKAFCTQQENLPLFKQIVLLIAPWTFTAGIPSLIRNGPIAYKAVILDAFILPAIVLTFAAYKVKIGSFNAGIRKDSFL